MGVRWADAANASALVTMTDPVGEIFVGELWEDVMNTHVANEQVAADALVPKRC